MLGFSFSDSRQIRWRIWIRTTSSSALAKYVLVQFLAGVFGSGMSRVGPSDHRYKNLSDVLLYSGYLLMTMKFWPVLGDGFASTAKDTA